MIANVFKTYTYEDIGKVNLEWLKMAGNMNVSMAFFAENLGHTDFVASVGLLDKFMKRHNIIQKVMCGGSADVNKYDCQEWRNNILSEF